ncbi:MAG: DUF4112 domain-containing protein [Gemmatimonadaceae bacterium]
MTPPTDPLVRARALTRLLDSAARIPGTGIRFGLDPILGLVPGLGDVAGAVLSGYLVLLAQRLGAPRVVVLRMLANVAADTVGGTVPILGDAFDVAFKSSSRNLALLERTLDGPTTEKRASWLVVGSTLAGLAILAIGGIVVALLVIKAIAGAVNGA